MDAVKLSILATFLGLGSAVQAEPDWLYSDSGVERPAYQKVLNTMAELERASSGWVTTVDYGHSVDGRTLRAVKIQDPSLATSGDAVLPAVLISGATHGNEYLGFEDQLPGWFYANRDNHTGVGRFFHAGGAIFVVPVVNPDGFTDGMRENSHGIDLNRDFDLVPMHEAHFHESETRDLAFWFDRELSTDHLRLKLTVDYHCCDGSLLYPWAYSRDAIPERDQKAHDVIGKLMRQDIDAHYQTGPTGQVLGYLARGTSKDYYYAKYGALAFTFEGSYRSEASNYMKHQIWWDHVLGKLVNGTAAH